MILNPYRMLARAWCALVCAYTTWCWYNFSGVYKWLANWEMAHLGHYYVVYTWVFATWILILPAAPFLRPDRSAQAAPPAPPSTQTGLKFILVGVATIGLGAALALVAWHRQGQGVLNQPPNVVVLDKLKALPSDDRPLIVHGVVQPAYVTYLETDVRGTKIRHYCVPLTAHGWKPPQPVRYFLETDRDAGFLDPNHPGVVHTLSAGGPAFDVTTRPVSVHSNALPGPLLDVYRAHHLNMSPDGYYVLDEVMPPMSSPIYLWIAGVFCGIVGFALGLCGLGTIVRNFMRRS